MFWNENKRVGNDEQRWESSAFQPVKRDKYEKMQHMSFFIPVFFRFFVSFFFFLFGENLHAQFEFLHTAS